MKAHAIGLILMTFAISSAVAGQKEVLKYTGVVHKDSRGMSVAFPDICKTPSPAAPVPTPYPNVGKSSSDFRKGTKKVKGGGTILLTEEKVRASKGDRDVYRIRLVDKSGRVLKLSKSQLIELDDGSFCAVCVNTKGAVTALLRLEPVRVKRTRWNQDQSPKIICLRCESRPPRAFVRPRPLEDCLSSVVQLVESWCGNAGPQDDVSLVAIEAT